MERTWKPTTAGILAIIAGIVGIIGGCWFAGIPIIGMIAVGIVALIGGIYALRRRLWGLALAGAICAAALLPHVGRTALMLGVPAVIFLSLGRQEFA